MSHWSSFLTVCFPPQRAAVQAPEAAKLDVLWGGNREMTGRNQEVWPHAPYICGAVIDPTPWQVPVQGESCLVPSCFWKGQYSTLFLPSQEVGELVTSCVFLVKKLDCPAKQGLYKIV